MRTRNLAFVWGLFAIVGCLRSVSLTPKNSDAPVIARATTYEWLAYPGMCTEPVAPDHSLPRVTNCDCWGLNVYQCQELVQCIHAHNQAACNAVEPFFSGQGPPGQVPRRLGAAGGVRPTIINPFWNQTAWHVNPSAGNDAKDCTSTGTACATMAEVYARWATINAHINSAVTITLDTSQTNAEDPIWLDPVVMPVPPDVNLNGGQLEFIGTTSSASAGSATIVGKTPSSNTYFTVTGTAYQNTANQFSFFQNTSRSNSIAWQGEAGSIKFSQPLLPATIAGNGEPIAPPSEATSTNLWTTGDTINVVSLPLATILEAKPTLHTAQGQGVVIIQHVNITSLPSIVPSGVGQGDEHMVMGDGVDVVESVIYRGLYVQATSSNYLSNIGVVNCNALGGIYGGPQITQPPSNAVASNPAYVAGGVIGNEDTGGTGANSMSNWLLERGVFLSSQSQPQWFSGYNYFGEVTIDVLTKVQLNTGGVIDLTGGNGQNDTGLVWGTGTLDPMFGTVRMVAGSEATEMPISHLNLDGQTTACCITGDASPSTVNCGITLSTTNLNNGNCSSSSFSHNAFAQWGPGRYVSF